MAREQRKLAAIVAADVVGYSRLMGRDESGTLARLRKNRSEQLDPVLAKYGGRLVKLTGDGALVEFASAVDALSAAIEFQQGMAQVNAGQPADTALVFRMGLHLGDLIVDGDDLYGDGVNVAARLEGEAAAGGILISGNVRDAVGGRLKATFEDLGGLSLKNIERPVQAFNVRWEPKDWLPVVISEATTTPLAAPQAPLPLPDKPSIAVLPFQNMSGDPEQEYFADGMVEDIITALSRTKALFVIARNSTFSYKGKSPDIRQVGRELGVRYVLEGSVRKAGTRIRITGQLIDALSGAHLWADRFDGALEDIFDLQDEIASRVVGEVAPALEEAEITRSTRKVGNLEAYDYYLRGLAALPGYSRENLTEAQLLLAKAVALDPKLAIAWATQAFRCVGTKSMVRDSDPAHNAAEAEHAARTALRMDRNDARVLALSGHSLGFVCRRYEEAAALLEEAVRLDPNLAVGWTWRGTSRNRFGQHELAIADLERAMRLSPRDAFMFLAHGQMAAAHFFAGRHDEAVHWAESSLRLLPHHVTAHRVLVAAHALAGRTEAARRAWLVYREYDPETRLETLSERLAIPNGPNLAMFVQALRLAGMPE
ncbi:adenylate cyclase [Reyranella soli]|uniref:Adenylate cyclase n=1 Tax=Reyranella soli TaxID=1230389 RepID=A0A512NSH2_9HYPH|nr:adenylate cyclase [Reyranella soli]